MRSHDADIPRSVGQHRSQDQPSDSKSSPAPYYVFKDAGTERSRQKYRRRTAAARPPDNEAGFVPTLHDGLRRTRAAEAQLGKTVRLESMRPEELRRRLLSGRPRSDVGSPATSAIRRSVFSPPIGLIGMVLEHRCLRHVETGGKLWFKNKEVYPASQREEEAIGLTK